jgi:hypothetical protein
MKIVGHSSWSLGSNIRPSENGRVVASETADPNVRSQAEHQRARARTHTHIYIHTHTLPGARRNVRAILVDWNPDIAIPEGSQCVGIKDPVHVASTVLA